MTIKTIRNLALTLALMGIVSLISFKLGENQANGIGLKVSDGSGFLNTSLMAKVKNSLDKSYLDKSKIDEKKLSYGAIQGMVASLGDPYTVFLPPSDNKASTEDLAGEFGGVGISLGYKDNYLAVMAPLADTPAAKAGLLAGDYIIKITDKNKNIDKDTTGIALDEAVSLIRGKIGTEVTLKIVRSGKPDPFEVTLKRENIVVASVEMEVREKDGRKMAWIKLNKFTERLDQEWDEAVDKVIKLKQKEANNYGGVVLDLRNNPGGYLQASVMVASDFLDSGVVVKQESSDGRVETYEVQRGKQRLLNDKMVILVNGGSASAAEILAGALKDYNRGKLVGDKTFGKGTVQQPEDYPDGSGLHVTIARWLLPNGNNIHKVGVNPDVEVKYELNEKDTETDNQLDKALEVLLQK